MAPEKNFASILKELESGPVRPLYVILGEDDGLRELAVAAVRRAVFGEGEQNVVTFGPADPAVAGSIPKVSDVMDEARTGSLFTGTKLVLVRGAGALLSPGARKSAEGEDEKKGPPPMHAALLEFVKNPPGGSVLVLETEKLDGRSALAKALEASGAVVTCPRMYDKLWGETEVSMRSPMGIYLSELARARGLSFAKGGGERLLEAVNGQAGRLSAELDKLAEYLAGKKRPVTAEDVEAMAPAGASGGDPVVLGALSGNAAEALAAAEKIFARGMEDFTGRMVWDEQGIAIILISSLSRKAFDVERAVSNGGRFVAKGKTPPPSVTRPVEEAARRLGGGKMERVYRLILEADRELKSSSGRSPRAIVEDLVIALAG